MNEIFVDKLILRNYSFPFSAVKFALAVDENDSDEHSRLLMWFTQKHKIYYVNKEKSLKLK